jgi:transcriptional regulator with XRE-family HTH domain
MRFNEKLKKLLRRYKRKVIAAEAGIHQTTLNALIRGNNPPSMNTASRLAEVLGVSVGWLIDDSMPWPPLRSASPDADSNETQTAKANTAA